MNIGPYLIDMPVVLAPMAGISDLPFRHIVARFGVGMTVAEMVSSRADLQNSRKHQQRRISLQEPLPRAIQIVGNDPQEMAAAAALNEDLGAGLIDINMGCPAKKVCRKAAGSALLGDEKQVRAILQAVVKAVEVPVTLKIRTGVSREQNNALNIARIAEEEGIQSLVIHGRSRACMFSGEAEYETIRMVKARTGIPVIANGDITDPLKAKHVLHLTAADAVMVGRAAQGQPWLPAMIGRYLLSGDPDALRKPGLRVQKQACLDHIAHMHRYYGEKMGVRIARKHIRWYLAPFDGGLELSQKINRLDCAEQVLELLREFYDQQHHCLGSGQSESIEAIAA